MKITAAIIVAAIIIAGMHMLLRNTEENELLVSYACEDGSTFEARFQMPDMATVRIVWRDAVEVTLPVVPSNVGSAYRDDNWNIIFTQLEARIIHAAEKENLVCNQVVYSPATQVNFAN